MSQFLALLGLVALFVMLRQVEKRVQRTYVSPPLPGAVGAAVVFVAVLASQGLRDALSLDGWASVAAAAGIAACAHIAVSCVWAWRKAARRT